jgi:phosphotriesterase-related protein
MNKINTVCGPVQPEDLGLTLSHEHIVAAYPGWECDPLSRPYDREKIIGVCMRALGPVREFGVRSVIDATPADLSRDVEVMKRVSELAGINIICATGRYTEEEGKWAYLKQRSRAGVGNMREELYDGFMREITQGIGGSGVRPGVIKVATGRGTITPLEEAMLRAAAGASRETGVPVITHTEDGTMGPEQADVLTGEGADPDRIMIGHMCGNPSLEYQMDVLKRGVSISFDRFGIELFLPDKVRTAVLAGLLAAGYAGRIMLSQDFIACGFGRGGSWPDEVRRKMANWSFVNLFRNIVPALKKAGVTEGQIRTMTVDNPRRLLAGA